MLRLGILASLCRCSCRQAPGIAGSRAVSNDYKNNGEVSAEANHDQAVAGDASCRLDLLPRPSRLPTIPNGGLKYWGAIRARGEALDGQFRRGFTGNDSVLALRSSFLIRYDGGNWGAVAEFLDSRSYFDDENTPISTSLVNVTDILQAYLALFPGSGKRSDSVLKLGRFTLDVASRRFVERNGFRNTINAYTGGHWHWKSQGQFVLDAFYTFPVRRLPLDRESLSNNEFELDQTDSHRQFWGVHLQRPELFGEVQGEVFVYGLQEQDSPSRPTPDRDLYTPGFRLYSNPSSRRIRFRTGSRLPFRHAVGNAGSRFAEAGRARADAAFRSRLHVRR